MQFSQGAAARVSRPRGTVHLGTNDPVPRPISVQDGTLTAMSTTSSGLNFLFTGKLAKMSRSIAELQVEVLGGTNAKTVNDELDVLVVGDDGSPLLGAGAKSAKQLKAEKLNAAGASIQIISEFDFLQRVVAATSGQELHVPTTEPKLTLVRSRDAAYDQETNFFNDLASNGDTLFAAAGMSILKSETGESWTRIRHQDDHCTYEAVSERARRVSSGEYGYAAVWVDGDALWVAGAGFALSSPDGGASFAHHALEKDFGSMCVVADRDEVWVGGRGLFVGRGGSFERVNVAGKGSFNSAVRTPFGPLLLRDDGTAYLGRGGSLLKLGLKARAALYGACRTRSGATLLLGRRSFRTADFVDFAPIEVATSLTSAAVLVDGRIIGGGPDDLLYVSYDDGRSFQPLLHAFKGAGHDHGTRQFPRDFIVLEHRGAVLATGSFQATLRVE